MNRVNFTDRTLIFVLILLFIHITPLPGITVYMNDIVRAGEHVTLGSIISVKDTPYYLKKQIEEKRLPLEPERIHLLPSRYVREILSGMTKQPVIMIGRNTGIVPDILFKEWGNELTTRFIHFLITVLCKDDNRVEADLLSYPPSLATNREQGVMFHFQNNRDYMGYPIGKMDAYFAYQHSESNRDMTQTYTSGPGFEKKLSLYQQMEYNDIEKIDYTGEYEPDELHISLDVHQYIPAVKAGMELLPGEELAWDKLIVTEVKLNPFQGEVLIPDEKIKGLQTIKKIRAGEVLYTSYVRKSLKVQAGEKIMITFLKGNIILSMTGRAGESGGIGDLVRVRPSQSTQWITGEVTGSGEVLIEM